MKGGLQYWIDICRIWGMLLSLQLLVGSVFGQSYDKKFEIKVSKQPSTNDPTVQIDVNLQSRWVGSDAGGVNRYFYSNGRLGDAAYSFVTAVFLNSAGTEIGEQSLFRYSDADNTLGQSGTFNVAGFHVDLTGSNNCANASGSGPQFQYLSQIGLVTNYSNSDGALRTINSSNVSSRRDGFGNEVSLRVTFDLSEINLPTGTSSIEFVHLVYGDDKYVNVNSSGVAVACNPDNNSYYVGRSGGSATGSLTGYHSGKVTSIPSFNFGGGITSFGATTDDCDEVTLSIAHNFPSTSLLRTRFFRRQGSGPFTLLETRSGVPSAYTNTPPLTNTNYEYRVEVDHFYYGPLANSNDIGSVIGPLNAPTNLVASQNECEEINLSWDAVPQSTGYRIFRNTTNVKPGTPLIDVDGSSSTYTDAVGGGDYYYWVDTKNACDDFSSSTTSALGTSVNPTTTPTNLSLTQQTNDAGTFVSLEWDDVNFEDEIILEKSEFGEGTQRITLPPNTVFYEDEEVVQCRLYRYRILASNGCGESLKSDAIEFTFTPDISPIFDNENLTASKGYFPNKVELNWSFDNSFSNSFNAFKIFRRPFGESQAPALINSVNSSNTIYIDDQADAGVIYEYFIFAEGQCENTVLTSHDGQPLTATTSGVLYDIGFRSPAATISGNVSYEGGNAVENVKILAEREDGVLGSSVALSGNAGDYLRLPHTPDHNPTGNGFTLSLWIHPTRLDQDFTLVNKSAAANGYLLHYRQSTNELIFTWQGHSIAVSGNELDIGTFQNIAAVWDGSVNELFLYRDGEVLASQSIATTGPPNAAVAMEIGYAFPGYIDEILLFSEAKSDTEIAQDYFRIQNDDAEGLMAYYRLDEGTLASSLKQFFDASKQGQTYNGNNGTLEGAASYSTVIPTATQLGLVGFTNENGNYTLGNVRYSGVGSLFKLTPTLGIHEFDPGELNVFVGEGSIVLNNQDFIDISSFSVEGRVIVDPNFPLFQGNFDAGQEVPVSGVTLKIDGREVVQGGFPVVTGIDGTFSIDVPIGPHTVSIEKEGHTFSVGSFTSDFQDDLATPLVFRDTTTRIVTGRVVGGAVEAEKPFGLGLTNNNIGQVDIEFKHAIYSDRVSTTIENGEYFIELPPLLYNVPEFTINYSSGNPIAFNTDNFNMVLDLRENIELQTVEHTYSDGADSTFTYHALKEWIYFAPPELIGENLAGQQGAQFIGRTETEINGNTISLTGLPFAVLDQGRNYTVVYKAIEKYVNADDESQIDVVPVTNGSVVINNNLSVEKATELVLNENGQAHYTFKAGNPNTQTNTDNQLSFSNSFTAELQVFNEAGDQVNSAEWLPQGSNTFRGFIFGSVPDGNSFAVEGPQVVDFILRDPPGSNSFARMESGQSVTTTESYSFEDATGDGISGVISGGLRFSTGAIGFDSETEIVNEVELGTQTETRINENGELEETVTFTETITTSTLSEDVGAAGDLYIGKSTAFVFGLANQLGVFPISNCNLPGVVCYSDAGGQPIDLGGSYALGVNKSLAVVPGGQDTRFVLSQSNIINFEIPRLEALRNALFVNQPGKYQSKLTADDPNFGLDNTDEAFNNADTTITALVNGTTEFDGPSYTFIRPNLPDETEVINGATVTTPNGANIDSVRWYNQQIRLWQDAIRQNEEEKYRAITGPVQPTGFTYNAGPTIERSTTTTRVNTTSQTIQLNVTDDVSQTLGAFQAGAGFSVTSVFTLERNKSTSTSQSASNTQTISYTLNDGDFGDRYTIQVYDSPDGNGPIFYTNGGETMCPHEDEVSSLFFTDNGGNPVVLSARTFQREQPTITVDDPFITNVPSDEAAVFTIRLGNNNPVGQSMTYILDNEGNEDGAIVLMDGVAINTEITVPAGGTVTKQVTVRKGPGAVYEYDDIVLEFHSDCQFTDGTREGVVDIGESVTLRAHFIPSCSEAEILAPLDEFVINNSFADQVPVRIGNYDINDATLEKLEVQYKSSFEADNLWKTMDEFYVNPVGDQKAIPTNATSTDFLWDISDRTAFPDDQYDIRVRAHCVQAIEASEIFSGLVDRTNPVVFGVPSPGDGILSPNDNISIRFNETINAGIIGPNNFDVRGVLNGSDLRNSTYITFDGANDELQSFNPVDLERRAFSIELWINRQGQSGEQVFLNHGQTGESLELGFDQNNQPYLKFESQSLANPLIATVGLAITGSDWVHLAFILDIDNNEAVAIAAQGINQQVDRFAFPTGFSYLGTGDLIVGRNANSTNYFQGALHELRIWGRAQSEADIASLRNKNLIGREAGLLHCWPLDEGIGELAADKVRQNNIEIDATWGLSPAGKSAELDGSSYVEVDAPLMVINNEMDMTIEFWVKGNNVTNSTLLSNGKGDGTDGSSTWAIKADANGALIVQNNGETFEAVSNSPFDDDWHHFAMVLNRQGNTNIYLDAQLVSSTLSNSWGGFAGSKFIIGARGFFSANTLQIDQHFQGYLDEIRIWNTARSQNQLEQELRNRLNGDEPGLLGYWPFEAYSLNAFNIPQLSPTFDDQAGNSPSQGNEAVLSDQSPTILLQRPVQTIGVDFAINDDEIILTPGVDPAVIENVTLNITVSNIRDLAGNALQSPKSWIAFVDKNQLGWSTNLISLDKPLGEPLAFQTTINNSGGDIADFEITNLPAWISASPGSGSISPNSSQEIEFLISENINIGSYNQGIHLSSDFGFDEILFLDLEVTQQPPADWVVDPSDFDFSMNVIGQVSIEGILSNDPGDILAAFVDNEIRGLAYLQYLEAFDNHQAFLTIYSNEAIPDVETIEYRVWDASAGVVRGRVIPDDMTFAANTTLGQPASPVPFEVTNGIVQDIAVAEGWQWISFNLASSDLQDPDMLLNGLPAENGDVIKGIDAFDQYSVADGWLGTISAGNGLNAGELYKLRLSGNGTLQYQGTIIDPATAPISIVSGWNWIGFLPQENIAINEALAGFNATSGDLIKSQSAFAIYDSNIGWLGSLTSLRPGEGYMLDAANAGTLTFPSSGLINGRQLLVENHEELFAKWNFNPGQHADNMSVIATLPTNENSPAVPVGAYINGELRGIATPVYLDDGDKLFYFLSVSGTQNGDEISFKALRQDGNKVPLSGNVRFGVNTLRGSLDEPVALDWADQQQRHAVALDIYPNPFDESIMVNLSGDQEAIGSIEILDMSGKQVRLLQPSTEENRTQVKWDGKGASGNRLPGGVYLMRIQVGNKLITKRVVKN